MSHSKKQSARTQPNQLAYEKSPYLLQHKNNPVNWYPWGEEAFNRARRANKPIFLSIGYSTCHWCHVMEKESFEDEEVAQLMNDTFISIKVDREERPDIDSVYMTVCQLMTNSGGWPLTIMMTPKKKPFFAATYIPRETKFGHAGMLELIPHVKELWDKDANQIETSADNIVRELGRFTDMVPGETIGQNVLESAYNQLLHNFDWQHGGFGHSPKFPSPHQLTFLLRYWKRTNEENALKMVEQTLQSMSRGGVYDHIGFGFHRYSTDHRWLLPHFEKMLYDQALLTMSFTEAYQVTKKEEYRQTATEILTYVARDMTSPEGGFYSAEDADSEGEEGKFYIWSEQEIRKVLPKEIVAHMLMVFNIAKGGNFTDESTGLETGKNIIYPGRPIADIAADLQISEEELAREINTARIRLFEVRKNRIHPGKDDKILTDWNGLMIAAFSRAAQVFDMPEYIRCARNAADFIFEKLYAADRKLFHRYRDKEPSIEAFLDDYAFLIWGLIELYEASFDVSCLQRAIELNTVLLDQFWDNSKGGFFSTANNAETVLVRMKESYDGAIPSGNSVAMQNVLRLSRMTADPELEAKAEQIGRYFSKSVSQMPSAHTHMLSAVDFALGPSSETVIAGPLDRKDTTSMLRTLRSQFLPNNVVIFLPTDGDLSVINGITGFTKDLSSAEGTSTAYVCRNFQCSLPTTDPDKMLALLNEPS